MRHFIAGAMLACWLFGSVATAAEVRLSVAASLTDAFKELNTVYQQQADQVRLLPNFASSGSLAKQIGQGAPADIFVSANPEWMQFLVEKQLIPAGRVRTLVQNTLVFVGHRGLDLDGLADLAQLDRIAIGSPRSVPAGQYAEQALQAAGVYSSLRGRLVIAKDVRQALMYADRGETDGAFVYRTDAVLARNAVVHFEVPQNLHERISYPAGLTLTGIRNPAAIDFFDFLDTSAAVEILRSHGFIVR